MRYPPFKQFAQNESYVAAEFETLSDLIWFEGHFPEEKILPGVAVTGFLLRCMRDFLGIDLENQPCTFQQIKFNSPLKPDMTFRMDITVNAREENSGRISFTVTEKSCERICCSGKLKW